MKKQVFGWSFGAVVAVAVTAGCSSSGGGSGTIPTCKNPPASETVPPACTSCVEAKCSSEISTVESACSSYLSCVQGCDCSDLSCLEKCTSSETSACMTAEKNATCSACTSECSVNVTATGTGSDTGTSTGTGTGPVKCSLVEGTGASEFCDSTVSSMAGFTCASAAMTAGSCPSTGLVGCCVVSIGSGATAIQSASCY